MSIIRQALLYNVRNPRKSLPVLIVMIVMIMMAFMGLFLLMSYNQSSASLKEELGGYIRVEYKENAEENVIDCVMRNDIEEFPWIKACNGVSVYYLSADDMDLIPGLDEGRPEGKIARFCANTDTEYNENFTNGAFVLKEGRHVTPEDTFCALISEQLAKKNKLNLNDTFQALLTEQTGNGKADAAYTFTVVGIYRIEQAWDTGEYAYARNLAENLIFTDESSYEAYIADTDPEGTPYYSAGMTVWLQDASKSEEVLNEISALDGAENITLTLSDAAYERSASELKIMERFCVFMTVAGFIIGSVILALVLVMQTKERKHEIGILKAMGRSDRNMFGQLLWGNLLLLFTAGIVSLLIVPGLIRITDQALTNLSGAYLDANTKMNTMEKALKEVQMLRNPTADAFVHGVKTVNYRSISIAFALVLLLALLIVVAVTWITSRKDLKENPRKILSDIF